MTGRPGVKSFREISRFVAEDERGVLHTVVERSAVVTPVTFSASYHSVARGANVYHSTTSGDVLSRISENVFTGRSGALRLTRVDKLPTDANC